MRLSLASLFPVVQHKLNNLTAVCGFPGCPDKHFVRIIPGSRRGIRVRDVWYCSVDCFTSASLTVLSALSSRRLFETPSHPRLSLGLILLSKGFLTAEQLRIAGADNEQYGQDLESTLIRLGFATEKQLAAARSVQWGYPVLSQDHIGHGVKSDLPASVLGACSAVPFHYSISARRILLGFTGRVEHSYLESIERITGCTAVPCFVTPTDLRDQLGRVSPLPGYEEVVIDDPGTPERMARTVGSLAVEIGAKEADFAHCKNLVWTRLASEHKKLDVIFSVRTEAEALAARKNASLAQAVVNLG